MLHEKMFRNPSGTLKIETREHSILVSCGPHYQVECFEDNSWHFLVDTMDGEYKADLWHRPQYAPLWYGRETPSLLTQHSVTYGYNWAGAVEGRIVVEGRFTSNDGIVRVLTGGRGTMSVRQWHAYPSILPRELYSDAAAETNCETKFDTL